MDFRRLDREETWIAYFGLYEDQQSYFNTSKPFTDEVWAQMSPELLETTNNFRSQRLEKTVYRPRRDLLVSTPSFDLLPHFTNLARFTPFRDIIYAPEGTEMGAKPFESAFAQLPVLVDEWNRC
ncbi:hypothetical protein OG21DRAFT_1489930 [Imleria badia]|nr:hypothetical protein OG21DRAFT_1489930 [Imleria badia]